MHRRRHGDRDVHRAGQAGRRRLLDLEPPAPPASNDQQIELRARMRRPEVAVFRTGTHESHHFVQRKSFPGRSNLRVPFEIPLVMETEQRMEEAAVAHVQLGRLDLTLGEILVKRLQLTDEERGRQEIEISADGRVRHPEGTTELRRVPRLTMHVRHHRPEARQASAEPREIRAAGGRRGSRRRAAA